MRVLVTTMKDEGPFILEWVAHYLSIGFDHFIVNTNDCSDGTDSIVMRLQELGIATHIDNAGPWKKGPQGAAYDNAMAHPKLAEAEWILVADADEFLNIKVGDGTLDALFDAVPKADLFSFCWQLFGHNGRVAFEDALVTEQFDRSADPYQQWPAMCRALKTLYRADAGFGVLSTHRPKKPARGWRKRITWVDGDGDEMTDAFGQSGWHAINRGIGFGTDLARMNHYAVRSISSYLMKRLRGDVRSTAYHRKLEGSGVDYWTLHCWNTVEDRSIQKHGQRLRAKLRELMEDAQLSALHTAAVDHHLIRVAALSATPAAQNFIKTFKTYPGAFEWQPRHDVVVCPDLALDRGRFATEDFHELLSTARAAAVTQARRYRRLPWFANFDTTGQSLGSPKLAADEVDEALRPISADTINECHVTRYPQNPKRDARRHSVLREVGKRGRVWAVLNSGEPGLVQSVLDTAAPESLTVINPWGFRSGELTIAKSARKVEPARISQEKAYFAFLDQFRAQILEGNLSALRGDPRFVLKTMPPAFFDVIFLSGAMEPAAARRLLDRAVSRLSLGGILILDSYHRRGKYGDAMQQALHGLLSARPGDLRIRQIEGAHCAVERLAPLKQTG